MLALWKCGNANLIAKLQKGVTEVCLEDNKIDSTSRYPKLLSQLPNLRKLILLRDTHYLMPSSQALSEELKRLAPSLTYLEIQSKDAEFALLQHAPNWTEETPLYVISFYHRGNKTVSSKLIDMERIFPQLRTLKQYRTHSVFNDPLLHIAGLPDTLTDLKTGTLHIANSNGVQREECGPVEDEMSFIEQNSFSSTSGPSTPSNLATTAMKTFPKVLQTHSTANSLSSSTNYASVMSFLPRHLETLHCTLVIDDTSLLAHEMRDAPPHLTSLPNFIDLQDDLTPELISLFPRHWTLLHISFNLLSDLTPVHMTALPPALRVLSSRSIDLDSFGDTSFCAFLPAALTRISLWGTIINARDIAALPNTLEKISYGRIDWKSLALLDDIDHPQQGDLCDQGGHESGNTEFQGASNGNKDKTDFRNQEISSHPPPLTLSLDDPNVDLFRGLPPNLIDLELRVVLEEMSTPERSSQMEAKKTSGFFDVPSASGPPPPQRTLTGSRAPLG